MINKDADHDGDDDTFKITDNNRKENDDDK